jgi:hypothetical protein
MGVTVYIGTVEVPTPGDVDGYVQRIVRDFDRRMIYSESPGTLTFTGGAYKILRDAFLLSFCDSLPVRIYDQCAGVRVLLVSGEIILADVKWSLARCSAEVPIQTSAIGARIIDNFNLVLTPDANTSKNGQAITPVAHFALTIFDPQNPGTNTSRWAYDWKASLQHAVDFLTDGVVTVDNVWYDALPDNERLAMVHGVYWRIGTPPLDPISWPILSLWLEIANRFNLWMVVKQNAVGNASIEVLSDADTFGASAGAEIHHVDGIEQSIDDDALFGSVVVGENREKNRTGLSFSALPYYLSLTHTEESYGVRCLCNRGDELDLRNEWVADHGTLEHVMWRDATDTVIDEDVCILQYTETTGGVTASEYASPTTPLYNESMLNYRVINRYSTLCDVITPQDPTAGVFARNDAILSLDQAYTQGSTATWVPEGSNIIATLNPNPPLPPSPFSYGIYTTWPVDTPPGGSDPDNAWTLGSRYTASSTAMRTITWIFRSSIQINSGASNLDNRRYWRMRCEIRLFNSANVLLGTFGQVSGITASGSFATYAGSRTIFMGATDYFTVQFYPQIVLPNDFQTVLDLSFLLSASPARTIRVTTSDLSIGSGTAVSRRVALIDFERHLSTAQWLAFLADPRTPITVDGAGLLQTLTWAKVMSRDIMRGTTNFTMIHEI